MEKSSVVADRERSIYRVTIAGSMINVFLLVFKFVAGILGGSAAMIADAVHSLSDFLTDIVVLVFVKLSSKPSDEDHDYGHGKYETLATALIGVALLAVGVMILYNGVTKTLAALQGEQLATPGWIALVAALLSIALKEWAFQFTNRVGVKVGSQAVVANAWHHRSDAFSSIGTAIGVGGAILLGKRWAVLDPIAAIIVSFFILKAAWGLIRQSTSELLEASLPKNVEEEIMGLVNEESLASEIHNLRTRRIGNRVAMEMHVRMPGGMTLYEAHQHATSIEQRIRKRFGQDTLITLHIEPQKVNGRYEEPWI
ncbi:MAG: cation transporter [Prevotella sp.]|nr:cation transporter [Prevotella sp.]